KDRTQYNVYARQPLFSGLKEFYGIRQVNALYAAKEHELRQARLDLLADVAEAFYAVLQLERDLTAGENSLKLARERLEELTQRNKVGISRRSEVLAQEAEVSSVQAGVESIRGALTVAREALKFATGMGRIPSLRDTVPTPGALPSVETL